MIEQPIRMVSCDTPEKAGYAGLPEVSQPKLDKCRDRLDSGYYKALPLPLRDYLVSKLTPDAAQQQQQAAQQASNTFDSMLEDRLTRPDGSRRSLAVIPTGEVVDSYGRLLAYLSPWYDGRRTDPVPAKNDPARRTFNLEMIDSGWAAFFPIYPSLPKNDDMNLAIASAEAAWTGERGVWGIFGHDFLLGYEFRACIKLGLARTARQGISDAFPRVCVDLRNLQIVGKYGFPSVPPCYRLWVWDKDLAVATVDLRLVA